LKSISSLKIILAALKKAGNSLTLEQNTERF